MFRKLIGACVGLAMMGMAGTAHAVPLTYTITFNGGVSIGLTTGSFSLVSPTLSGVNPLATFSATATTTGNVWTFDMAGPSDVTFTSFAIDDGVDIVALSIRMVDSLAPFGNGAALELRTDFIWFGPGPAGSYSISAAPEPSTLALFATGLALLGFMGWRRRRAVQAT